MKKSEIYLSVFAIVMVMMTLIIGGMSKSAEQMEAKIERLESEIDKVMDISHEGINDSLRAIEKKYNRLAKDYEKLSAKAGEEVDIPRFRDIYNEWVENSEYMQTNKQEIERLGRTYWKH